MFTTEITLNGETHKVKFGSKVMHLLAEEDIRLYPKEIFQQTVNKEMEKRGMAVADSKEISNTEGNDKKDVITEMDRDPVGITTILVHLGLISANPKTEVTRDDLFDWIDECGGVYSEETQRLITLFFDSTNKGVPKKKGKVKTTPNPKTPNTQARQS